MSKNPLVDGCFPPIIVTGMHRSGTTLVSGMLQALGVDMGSKREINEESVFFLRINRWILREAGASWFAPDAAIEALSDPYFRALVVEAVRARLDSSPWADRVLGGGFRTGRGLWGFKDPRVLITFPVWQEIYPDAKLITIRRDGFAVAKSLAARARRHADEGEAGRRRAYRKLTGAMPDVASSWTVRDLERGVDLWSKYCSREALAGSAFADSLELVYESLLVEGDTNVDDLAQFIGVNDPGLRSAARDLIGVPSSGISASPDHSGLSTVAIKQLREFGYGN